QAVLAGRGELTEAILGWVVFACGATQTDVAYWTEPLRNAVRDLPGTSPRPGIAPVPGTQRVLGMTPSGRPAPRGRPWWRRAGMASAAWVVVLAGTAGLLGLLGVAGWLGARQPGSGRLVARSSPASRPEPPTTDPAGGLHALARRVATLAEAAPP